MSGVKTDHVLPANRVTEIDHDKRLAAQIEATIHRLCEQLDQAGGARSEAMVSRRRDRRFSFRRAAVPAIVDRASGGGGVKIKAYVRNLSSGGLAFLHTSFLYPGSTCTMTLTRKDGEPAVVSGTILQCRHIQGPWHESSVRFLKRVDPLLFLAEKAAGTTPSGGTAELGSLAGRLLYVDDSKLDQRLIAHYIRGSQISLQCVSSPEEVTAAIHSHAFDILLCELNLSGRNGLDVVKEARDFNFCGPIVLVTAETRGDRLASAKTAGVSHSLTKPYQQRALLQLLTKLHEQVGALVSSEVLYSSIDEEPNTKELIAAYVEDSKVMASRLQEAIAAGDVSAAREICLSFKGSAAGYGFIPLQTAAEGAVTALDSTMSIDESRAALRKLELLCGRLALRSADTKPAAGNTAHEMVV